MLEFYYRKFCPYSRKVCNVIEKRGLSSLIKMYEIGRDREAMVRLKALIGGQQVPCLVINGEPLLESDSIISWLETNTVPAPAFGDAFRWGPVSSPFATR